MDASSSNDKRAQESGDLVTPSAKRQKLGERKSDVADDYLVPLRLTARSGYLLAEEVARLLLLTGKTFMGDIFGDLVKSSDEVKQGNIGGCRIEDVGPFRYCHNVEVGRNEQTNAFGFYLHSYSGRHKEDVGCQVIMVQALTQSSEVIEEKDVIISINGKNVEEWICSKVLKVIRAIRGNTINLSIRRFRPDVKLQIWKCICQHKWRDSKVLGQLMKSVGNRCRNGEADWEGLFRLFYEKRVKKKKNLSSLDKYMFYLSLYDTEISNISPIACHVLNNIETKSLIEKGESGLLQLESPIRVGVFDSMVDIRKKVKKWKVGLHVLRKTDKKILKLGTQFLYCNQSLYEGGGERKDGEAPTERLLYFERHMRHPSEHVLIGGKMATLITGIHKNTQRENSIEFARNLLCKVKGTADGRYECVVDTMYLKVYLDLRFMDGRESALFSKHKRLKEGVNVADFLDQAVGWE